MQQTDSEGAKYTGNLNKNKGMLQTGEEGFAKFTKTYLVK